MLDWAVDQPQHFWNNASKLTTSASVHWTSDIDSDVNTKNITNFNCPLTKNYSIQISISKFRFTSLRAFEIENFIHVTILRIFHVTMLRIFHQLAQNIVKNTIFTDSKFLVIEKKKKR